MKANNLSFEEQIKKAKAIPIQEIYPGQVKQSGATLIGLCPLHDDHNPSFAIYPDTNSWFCFAGCGGGDVISFIQKLYNLDFKEAIERLSV